MDTAAATHLRVAGAKLDGHSVDLLYELTLIPEAHKLCEKSLAHDHYIVLNCHIASS
jgi:hypothetical protein